MRRLLLLLAMATIGCGPGREIPLDGSYTRAAFHLVLLCPERAPFTLDLLYPVNQPNQTFKITVRDRMLLNLTWGGEQLATGYRDRNDVALDFTRRDPFTSEISWQFRGHVRDDLRFHERTIVGNMYGKFLDAATGDSCQISPRSVAWFTTRPRDLGATLDPHKSGEVDGLWTRFVWFLDVGPYAMSRRGDPGQRGPNLRLFSFASTGGGRITTGNQVAFVDNGFGEIPWQGAARGTSVTYAQNEYAWELEHAGDVLWDDGMPASHSPGIRRVLGGFVGGRYRIGENDYPFGWEGETGLLPLTTPGFAFFLDVDRGPEVVASSPALAVRVPFQIEPSTSPAVVLIEGVPAGSDFE